MITLIFVDDVIFFGTDRDKIDKFIKELEDNVLSLTVEEDMYALL